MTALSNPASIRAKSGASLIAQRSWTSDWIFATFSIACWSFAPFLRRLIDWRTGGFHAIEILSILPLLSIMPLVRYALKDEARRRVPRILMIFFTVWTVSLAYGFAVAALSGNIGGGLYEAAQYELPAVFGFWLAGQSLSPTLALRRLVAVLMVLGGMIALYGLCQWVSPPVWDSDWIEQSGFTSMGRPEPFALRIFSTLSSTGPAADFFAIAILFALPTLRLRNVLAEAAIPFLLAALMLTLVREAWIGFVLGIFVYLAVSPKRLKVLPYVAGGALLVFALISSLPTLLGNSYNAGAIVDRLQTLTDVEHDNSAEDRQGEYSDALDDAARLPFGIGLGAFGSAARLSGSVDVESIGKALDGGYVARLLSLGWGGFLLYVLVTLGVPIALLIAMARGRDIVSHEEGSIAAVGIAIASYLAWGDVAGDSHLGFTGLLFWAAISLGFRAVNEPNGRLVIA